MSNMQQQQQQQQSQGQPPGNVPTRIAWQVESEDVPLRREVITHILALFKRSSGGSDWKLRLPEMVKRLEEGLYRNAASKAEYADVTTLQHRIQIVAQQMRSRGFGSRGNAPAHAQGTTMIPTPGLAPPASTSRRDSVGVSTTGSVSTSVGSVNGSRNPANSGVRVVQNAQHVASASNSVRMAPAAQHVPNGKLQHANGHYYHNVDSKSLNGRVESPFIGGAGGQYSQSSYFGQSQIQRERFQIQKPENPSLKMIPVPGLPSQMVQQLQSSEAKAAQNPAQRQEVASQSQSQSQASTSGSASAASSSATSERSAVSKKVVFQMFRHSSKCTAPPGQCNVVSACAQVRQLMDHASKCQGNGCSRGNCSIARQVLHHMSVCSNAECQWCLGELPVRKSCLNTGSSGAAPDAQVSGKRTRDDSEEQKPGEGNTLKKVKVEPGSAPRPVACGTNKGKGVAEGAQVVKREAGVLEPQPQPGETVKLKTEVETSAAGSSVSDSSSKSGGSKVLGISFLELFTDEQINEHIASLRLWVGQSKTKVERNQALEQQMSESACALCGVEKLSFDPPPLYCTACGVRVKRNVVYYTAGLGETKHFFCTGCYGGASERVEMEGQLYDKGKLEKKKNDEETEEAWVQCDRCNQWHHQICALFNGKRNEAGDTEYVCAQCLMNSLDRKPLLPTSVLVAKDLPRTHLSDHLEQRLAQRLHQERSERARFAGKSYDEVPGAEGLVVRVVSSTDKKLEVKQRFMELFKDSDYPKEYLYKSKVVLLFQKIEGVEVCLFGMYVQEFGAECPQPNNRRLYIAYLDSIKYFRPEVKTVNGEALRTFVYHEILIGYLEHCKARGFGSCYIWACPPLRGEDYILYCHPEIQKTPRSDKLREWYLSMLAKATKENIVLELTTFYDYFFVSPEDCKAPVTAARLPYFDGDYWPGAAEDMLLLLHQEEEEKRKFPKKGIGKKGVAKRVGVQTEVSSNSSKDLQMMQKLGQTIMPMKEDFIMVHMHHSCRHCRLFITSGYRWVCRQCKSFQLCHRCYVADQKLDERERHPCNSRESHEFYSVEVTDVPAATEDKDEIMESEIFDTRQAFLSLCQGNHYQHDTLRRAKHSSMMVLYHLHNPTAPAFVLSCNLCNQVIETGSGWKCDVCADFDVCAACYPNEVQKHPHSLKPQTTSLEREQNKEARQLRITQLRKMMELLVHSAQCCAVSCRYPRCRNVKNLFRHGTTCKTRASGGCGHCKMMWHLMQLHARACKDSDCRVPRCKDLKDHLKRLQSQSESRRRAAMMEMVRQRATEAENT